ncbi:putative ribosomal N-acetyltransferase YdaF [compost metagenome]
MDWQARKFEIGYWIRTSSTRQGYVTEAVHAITKFAIEQLDANRIEIRCDLRNQQSANVAKRCGFIQEGILRSNTCDVEGAISSTMIFSNVRDAEF